MKEEQYPIKIETVYELDLLLKSGNFPFSSRVKKKILEHTNCK